MILSATSQCCQKGQKLCVDFFGVCYRCILKTYEISLVFLLVVPILKWSCEKTVEVTVRRAFCT